ncbi:MAG: hypothetical protein PVF74_11065 [Anaerolineales bacterium]
MWSRERLRERVDLYVEIVVLIGKLLLEEATTYLGECYWVHEAQMHPSLVQEPLPPFALGA